VGIDEKFIPRLSKEYLQKSFSIEKLFYSYM
jgi:hypothetical protein